MMKIRELYLKNFGKFSNERIVVKDGINIFYGENESGKTTIHTFIKSMLFGMERGRGRASINDTFSIYEPWENPNYYSGVLRFESGGKNFCLSRNFDKYSKSATLICEDDGEEFSLEHGDLEMILNGLCASDYDNTVAVGQMKIETNQSLAAELQNYATNYYSTGNDDIDLEGAINSLNKKKKETERELDRLNQERKQKRSEMEQEKSYIWRDMHRIEEEIEEVEEKIEIEQEAQDEVMAQRRRKWRVHPGEVIASLAIMILVFLLLEEPWSYLVTLVLFLAEGMLVWNRIKEGKEKPQEQVIQETESVLQKLLWQKERLQESLKEKQILYGNIQEQMDELGKNDEYTQKLENQKLALELAAERLLDLSTDVRAELSVSLNEKASEILKEITGGKYEMLLIDDRLKMSLYSQQRRVTLEQVSRGTIEQIYFALRMAASEILHEEEYPVILDDTFVYYDDVRLENTLRWLSKNKKQVLIFTCQKREQEILEKIL